MDNHTFILTPGEWIGHGKIMISGAKEEIPFITKWKILPIENGIIIAEQIVEKHGVADVLLNRFRFTNFSVKKFDVYFENDVISDIVLGKGKYDECSILWAFQTIGEDSQAGLSGAEMYFQQSEDEYHLKAEYFLDEEHRTLIEGQIWRKNENSSDRDF